MGNIILFEDNKRGSDLYSCIYLNNICIKEDLTIAHTAIKSFIAEYNRILETYGIPYIGLKINFIEDLKEYKDFIRSKNCKNREYETPAYLRDITFNNGVIKLYIQSNSRIFKQRREFYYIIPIIKIMKSFPRLPSDEDVIVDFTTFVIIPKNLYNEIAIEPNNNNCFCQPEPHIDETKNKKEE